MEIKGKMIDSLSVYRSYGTGVVEVFVDDEPHRIQLEELLKLIRDANWETFTPKRASYPYIRRIS